MTLKAEQEWTRLDNVAKIFPSKSDRKQTSVFRLYCELTEQVDPLILQEAVDRAILEFPNFLYIMRQGVFWYYLEATSLHPSVSWEHKNVCGQIYDPQQKNLLFEVTYYKNRINLETYHVLSDGTGAFQFLKTILAFYFQKKYKVQVDIAQLDPSVATQKSVDGFRKYYEPTRSHANFEMQRVYHLKSKKRKNYMLVMEGIVSTKAVLAAARRNHTTMTGFLAALFIDAIHQQMTLQDERKVIVLKVPVNLRTYFPSATTRNFFGMIDIVYDFKKCGSDLPSIIQEIDRQLHEKLTKEKLAERMSTMSALEHNWFLRIVPLPLKNLVLSIVNRIHNAGETAVLSNVGRVDMPEEMKPYLRRFGTFTNTLGLQLTLCSFEDQLQLGFTSYLVNRDVMRDFYRSLQKAGIDVEIRCNDFYAN